MIGTADRLAGPVEANSEYERWAHTRSIGALVACDSQKGSAGAPDLPGRRAHCDVGLDRLIGIGQNAHKNSHQTDRKTPSFLCNSDFVSRRFAAPTVTAQQVVQQQQKSVRVGNKIRRRHEQ